MFAIKKGTSIGNSVVKNKQLSIPDVVGINQCCSRAGCRQCPLVNNKTNLSINGQNIRIPKTLNCKSKNVIYMWVCFGRTTQECHDRTSGHRGCFNEDKWDKSALSMHARDMHQNQFTLDNFRISVVKKVSPQRLRREEFKSIEKYKTLTMGLNRYKV